MKQFILIFVALFLSCVSFATPLPITGSTTVCAGDTATLSDATPGGTWSSSAPAIAAVGSLTGVVTGISAGTATITYTIAGSYVTQAITVNPLPMLTSTLRPPVVCNGALFTYVPASSVPGTSFVWDLLVVAGISFSSISGTGSIIDTAYSGSFYPDTFRFIYVLTAGGCTSDTTIFVTVDGLHTISASASTPSCGGTVTLSTVGGSSYTWSPSAGLSCSTCSVATLIPSASMVYTVTGIDTFGCASSDTVLADGNHISGHITYTGSSTDSFKVWLIQFNPLDSSIHALDSTTSCMDAGVPYYEFTDPAPGSYMVKAKLNGTVPGASGYIPTYSLSTPNWYSAASVAHTIAADVMDITMVYGTVPPGPGFISGYVVSGAGRGTSGDVPAVGLLIYLQNASGNVLTYTYTDTAGHYSFSGLADGSYIVYPEDYKYYTTPSAVITLSPSAESDTSVDFKKHTSFGTITPQPNRISGIPASGKQYIYPNPVVNELTIRYDFTGSEDGVLQITDITGHVIITHDLNAQKQKEVLDMSNLPAGMYLYRLKQGNAVISTGKLIKS